jgi:hypothetical protein
MPMPFSHGLRLQTPAVIALTILILLTPVPVWAGEEISFSEDIFPIIQIRCLECHQPEGDGYEKSGLDLRTYQGLMKGTKFGTMVIPGNAFTSNLMLMIDGRAKIRMPHRKKKLSSCEIKEIRWWINQGAKDN